MKTAIIVDSTSYLPDAMLAHPDIYQINLSVTFDDGQVFEDLVTDAFFKDFYDYLEAHPQTVTTSQPPLGQYMELMDQLVEKGYERVLAFHLSSSISGTYQNARTILEEYQDRMDTYCYDSKGAAVVVMALVQKALALLEKGMPMAEIDRLLRQQIEDCFIYLTVEDLTYLSRGGRLKNGAALIGNLLHIKPILYFNELGEIGLLEKVRTQRRMYHRLAEIAINAMKAHPEGVELYFCHAMAEDVIQDILSIVEAECGPVDYQVGRIGPVIGAHVGLGSCGMATIPKIS